MKTDTLRMAVAAALLGGGAAAAVAADPEDSPDQFGVGLRLGFNIRARFDHLGGFAPDPSVSPGPATGGGLDRTYEDGFVHVDGSGNQGGLTWNWGYDQPSQLPGNDTVLMRASTADADLSATADGDPQLGMEFFYSRRLGGHGRGSWGVEIAFGYTDLEIHDSQTLMGSASVLRDAYSLGGSVAPVAPYAGSEAGPGVLIGDSPSRTLDTDPAGQSVSGERTLDGSLYSFRLGPYYNLGVTKGLSLQLGGGLAVGVVSSRFAFTETVSSAGEVRATAAGSDDTTEALVGAYADARLIYRLCRNADVYLGGQFQYLQDFEQTANGRGARLELGETAFLTAGIRLRF